MGREETINLPDLAHGAVLSITNDKNEIGYYYIVADASTMPEIEGAWGAEVYLLESCDAQGNRMGNKKKQLVKHNVSALTVMGLLEVIIAG